MLKVWLWWEHWYLWRHHVRSLTRTSAFMIEVRRYQGKPVTLADGTHVRRGDRIVELHLANHRVSGDATNRDWSPFQTLAQTSADLALIARLVHRGSLGPVRALHAVSLIAPALGRVGFTVTPLPATWHTRLLRFYMVGLLAVYHPRGWLAARRARDRAWPAEAWASVDDVGRWTDSPSSSLSRRS
ncbi:MAG: hypothetical protein WCB51_11345 [Candidatus Dormiibacterota bacterium]